MRHDARRAAAAASGPAHHGAAAWAAAPVLLLDETLIQEQHGIRREVQVGSKSPVLVAPDRDKPWEYCGAGMSKRIHLYGTVLYDDLMGKYRMWYMGRMGPHWRFPAGNYQIPGLYIPRTDARPCHCNGVTHDHHGRALQTNDRGDLTLYAESDDGLAWVKPQLGIFTFNGDPDNNIVWDLHGASVFIDREEPDPEKRYQAIGFCRRYRGIFLLTSPDGIHWQDRHHLEPVADRTNEGAFNVTWDSAIRCTAPTPSNAAATARTAGSSATPRARRWIRVRCWSRRAGTTPLPGAVTARCAPSTTPAFRASVMALTSARTSKEESEPCDGPIDAQSAARPELDHADRERTPVIPRGEGDAFGGMIIGTAKEPGGRRDSLVLHRLRARTWRDRPRKARQVPGRATWQRDRFIALHAPETGTVTTKAVPVPPGAQALTVNADAADGQVLVELCAAGGAVLDGFSRQRCVPLRGNELDWRVAWKTADLAAVREAVKIRFILTRSRLYSYRWS